MEAITAFVAKLGTVLVDRRFWIALIPLFIVLGILPATVDQDVKADELVAAVQMIVQAVGIIVPMLFVIYSWTKRPPSGKSFAANKQQAEAVYQALLDALKKG